MGRKKKEAGNGLVKIELELSPRIFDAINERAQDEGMEPGDYLVAVAETVALAPLLMVLHDDPGLARQVALRAIQGYLSGQDLEALNPEPEPSEIRQTLEDAQAIIAQISQALFPDKDAAPGYENINEPTTAKAPPKQGRGGDDSPPRPVFSGRRKTRVAPSRD